MISCTNDETNFRMSYSTPVDKSQVFARILQIIHLQFESC